jgi:hypothetical protein
VTRLDRDEPLGTVGLPLRHLPFGFLTSQAIKAPTASGSESSTALPVTPFLARTGRVRRRAPEVRPARLRVVARAPLGERHVRRLQGERIGHHLALEGAVDESLNRRNASKIRRSTAGRGRHRPPHDSRTAHTCPRPHRGIDKCLFGIADDEELAWKRAHLSTDPPSVVRQTATAGSRPGPDSVS